MKMSNICFTPPPPENRDKPKKFRNVSSALRASALTALGLLLALAMLLPNAAAEAQSSPVTATATATVTATATPTDYDSDDDGLIDINTLDQLNAVRYDLNGDGDATHADYIAAFPNRDSTATGRMGCPSGTCTGYELMRDLDFDADGDGTVEPTELYSNWTPIGTATNESTKFTATFKGNSNGATPKIAKIYNLTITSISGSASADAGLFGATSSTARIEGVGLVDVNVNIDTSAHSHLNPKIGSLVGNNAGDIIACYSTGEIEVTAGAGSYAGGLVGYNTGTIAAAFSRATVDIKMAAGVTGPDLNIYAGGLAGHNTGTLTATYAAGAVKGKGGGGYVGGLVGHNSLADGAPSGTKTIIASYSIAPVTAEGMTVTATDSNKPEIGGLTGCCPPDSTTTNTITASYWDYISSGVPDDDGTAMPEGKSTHALIAPTDYTGIYAGWNRLTIDGVNNVDPWYLALGDRHPHLIYGGHTRDISGNQYLAHIGIGYANYIRSGDTGQPREGMTLKTSRGVELIDLRKGNWIWESSTDGITWTTLFPLPDKGYSRTISGAISTFRFVPRAEHVGKYIRTRLLLKTDDYAVSRAIGKIKAASTTNVAPLGFASGHVSPRVDRPITVAALPSGATDAKGLWYRCDDDNTATPSGCELVGSNLSYTPGDFDLGHYIRAYIYYKKDGAWMRASPGFTPERVRFGYSQWRNE